MIKLYRIWNEKEDKLLKDGILSFEIKDDSLIKAPINTFYYAKDKTSPLAYKKHFFLSKKDAFVFSKYLDSEEKYVNAFSVPEKLVLNNLGFANVREEFFPLEVAISSKEIKETFNLESVNGDKPLEALYVKDSSFYLGEEQMAKETNLSYNIFSTMLNDILSSFYVNEEFSLVEAKRYLDDENNRKMLVEKVKELFYY